MKGILTVIQRLQPRVAAGGFGATCALVLAGAVARSLARPINWSMDLALFFFAWSVFLSADAAMRSGKLVNVDLLVNALPPGWKRAASIGNCLLVIAFLSILVVSGLWLSYRTRFRTFQGIPGFSYTWVTLSLPVGAAFLLRTSVSRREG